jgi:hypothetical protein
VEGRFMKHLFLILILTLWSISTFAQVLENPLERNLVLTGTVSEITMSASIVYVRLNLTLKNEGSVPVIFLQTAPSVSDATLRIGNHAVPETLTDILAKSVIEQTSSEMNSETWVKFKKSLEKRVPPKDRTLTILPKQTKNFSGFVKFDLKNTTRFKNQSLSLIQRLSPVEIHLICETMNTLPLKIDNKNAESLNLNFVKNLRKRWKKTGYIWIEPITSEPISIDFNSIIYKKLI